MKPVVSIVALAIALSPALAFAAPKDQHHGKHAVHAGQTHRAARAHGQVVQVSHKTHDAKSDKKDDAKPVAHKSTAKPKHHVDAPKKEDSKPEVMAAVAMTPMHPEADAKPAQAATNHHGAKPEVEKKNLPSLPDPDTAAVKEAEPAAEPTPKESTPELKGRANDAHPDAMPHDGSHHGTHHGKPDVHPKGAPLHAAKTPPPPCFHDPVLFVRGVEEERFSLTRCDGTIAPHAVDQLSILARPGNVQKPGDDIDALAKVKGADIAPGIKRIDPILIDRLQSMVLHFAKPGVATKIFLVSGYRPGSVGSFHQGGKAIDFRIEGVSNEALVEQCKKLEDTGCGYYPNSSFIHMDVRDAGAGHVSWIDASGPGEAPRYVRSWPERPADTVAQATPAWIEDVVSKLDAAHAADQKPSDVWAGRIGL